MDASLTVLLVMAIGSGLYMAWAIGANDVANSMGTSVGVGALTVGGAILIAGVFEFLGAFLAGGEVTATIRKGIIDAESLEHDPDLLVIGMLSALLAAAAWLTIASRFGWPVSTTHSIVGAIIGFAVVAVGVEAVHWWDVATIASSSVVTPLIAGAIAWLLVLSVQWLIFDRDEPDVYARRYVPEPRRRADRGRLARTGVADRQRHAVLRAAPRLCARGLRPRLQRQRGGTVVHGRANTRFPCSGP